MLAVQQQQLQVLYVAWQDPTSRQYFPVARLTAGVADNPAVYEFVYINAVKDAQSAGFGPFPSFPELSQAYRSTELFPFFANRLMSSNRPDYANHVKFLGLDPNADPMTILARSGGSRTTDSVELFSPPISIGENGTLRTFFWMHGYRDLNTTQQDRVLTLQQNEELFALPEKDNIDDPNAVRLETADHFKVGYLPRYWASEVICLLNSSHTLRVLVERVNPSPAPNQQRLLCRLEANWPHNSTPFTGDAYQPIPQDATHL